MALNLIRDGQDWFLPELGRLDLIAEKIVQLLQDKKLRERMGAAGRKFVEKFDWDAIADCTLRVYRERSFKTNERALRPILTYKSQHVRK